ncbi:hypothetical protein HELRODRAFT_163429 [Helobdella robusta]|uniref:Uncharacterized protein n=1 Tax=Helobdella robusta TaxID=6412 RepID=T1EU13_HELRO|nr:hypothetical protein HELRODRAFT_163429 [Helobdella robusta]ESN96371.1 hypothetical protein HELRODRAFT_163429 [Helobdella robusta]
MERMTTKLLIQSDHFKLTSTQQRRPSKFRQDTADDCQDPDPADVIDDITEKIRPMVKKAISCDSILSDLDGSTTEAVRLGQIELSVHYNRQTSELSLTIIQARDLERDDVRLFSAGGVSGGGGGVSFVGGANCGVDSFVQVSISPRNQGKFCTKFYGVMFLKTILKTTLINSSIKLRNKIMYVEQHAMERRWIKISCTTCDNTIDVKTILLNF